MSRALTRSTADAVRWQSLLDGWVLAAACAAIVGVSLEAFYHHGPGHVAGVAIGWAVWTVFAVETAVMLKVSPSPGLWARKHRFELAVLFIAFPLWALLADSLAAAKLVPSLKLLKLVKFTKLAKVGKSAKIIGKRSAKTMRTRPGPLE